MTEFQISILEWTPAGQGSPEDSATRCRLEIRSNGLPLSINHSEWSRTVTEWINVSAYPLALWIAANWWRLTMEPLPFEEHLQLEWEAAHSFAAAGSGYLWPPISTIPDGKAVTLRSSGSAVGVREPIRFLGQPAVSVGLDAFQQGLGDFVETVVARLRALDLQATELESLWTEVGEERSDRELTNTRVVEALLHLEPGEAPQDTLAAFGALADESGHEAALELAATFSAVELSHAAESLRKASRNGASLSASWDPTERADLQARVSNAATERQPPWRRGLFAARLLREEWDLGVGPLPNATIEERLGLTRGAVHAAAGGASRLNVGLAIGNPGDAAIRLLLDSRHPTARRFEAARLIGDLVNAPTAEAWHPATRASTSRQKAQRAFAAELLAPVDGLIEFLVDDRSDEALDEAAEHFQVSARTVAHQLENNAPA